MARLFNGSSDTISVSLNLTAYTVLSVSFWLYWDAFANDNKSCVGFGFDAVNGFYIQPNNDTGNFLYGMFNAGANSNGQYWSDTSARPSVSTWHHVVVSMDRPSKTIQAWIDGVSAVLSAKDHVSLSGSYGNGTLYLCSLNGASQFGAGRMGEVSLWGGVALTQSEVSSLAAASDPRLVHPSGLVAYWPMRLNQSPESDHVAGNSATVTGTVLTDDPPAILAPVGRPPGENWAA